MNYICVDTVNPGLAAKTLDFCRIQMPGNIKLLTDLKGEQPNFDIPDLEVVDITDNHHYIDTIEEYSQFMILDLWEYMEDGNSIIVQNDGYILNPDAWVDNFNNYDYIGAPWTVGYNKHKDFADCVHETTVGNGGFSMRSRRLCERMSTLYKDEAILHPEDLCYARGKYRKILDEEGFKFAPRELATKWAAEDNIYQGQFGFHGKITMRINCIPYVDGTYLS